MIWKAKVLFDCSPVQLFEDIQICEVISYFQSPKLRRSFQIAYRSPFTFGKVVVGGTQNENSKWFQSRTYR